ncbi:MAG: Pls/PosA family non-ribosomal peptide synthetase [Sciscionella sp.]
MSSQKSAQLSRRVSGTSVPRNAERIEHRVLTCAGYQQTVRWRDGERLENLFERRCEEMRATGRADQVAVDAGGTVLTYDQLDARANQLARYLLRLGVQPGDRIALLFGHAVHSYISMLAVLKIHAVYVPLDVSCPLDRLAYIVHDADVRMVLSLSHLRDRIQHVIATPLFVDEVQALVDAMDDDRLTTVERGTPVEELCYIIYTSGSTGRPKGVPIEHASICNFVRVAVEVYGIDPSDRVYQGMTIAFDFSVEEIWVPLIAGATLVPKPDDSSLLGYELHEFLLTHGITALCCVPTLLATLDEDLPGLRFLLVSGEACPEYLITRWHRPGRRFLNVYGPTETTVTATWAEVYPNRPVTIGVPLPTYSVVILDPFEERALPFGELGEIGIAGIGLASGYLNRDDLTKRAFIPDFLGIENNPSRQIYRTGDLGRVNDEAKIEYHGRIDTQVKIRGYRIELTEIESVLLQVPGIAQAAVAPYEPEPGITELVAYYSPRRDTPDVDQEQVYEHLRTYLPSYMVPAYLEELDQIPMTPSNKTDRKNLPAPQCSRSLATHRTYVAPANDIERGLAETLAGIAHLDQVSVDSNLFDDLGADSLLLARFCARVRERADLPSMSLKDVYLHPTVRGLAAALSDATSVPVEPPAQPTTAVEPVSGPRYTVCGALQMLAFFGYCYLNALILDHGVGWLLTGTGLLDVYLRSLICGAIGLLVLCTLPILAKWLLVGRWKRQEIPLWSLAYVRFWTVKTLISLNPMMLFVGSPLYVLYLRALGAKIGSGVAIFSRSIPVCTDLLTIGDGAVIRKDCLFSCYRAQAGRIHTGTVTLGKDAFVGEATVLDIDTSLGDGAQLGHTSCLHTTQTVPDGQRWHGSPAQPTTVDYRTIGPADCGRLRRVGYSVLQVLTMVMLSVPLVFVGTDVVITFVDSQSASLSRWASYRAELDVSLVLYFGGLLAGLILVLTVPRVLNLVLTPDRIYPLYGFHYTAQRMIARLTNTKTFLHLFGDSSYIVGYLRNLGYDLSHVEQTGSNFGLTMKHETPFLSSVGRGTMVSDGLSIINADFSSTSFRLTRTSIGPRNFLGNNIVYPSGGRTGQNCLLATKVMIPMDGEIRQNVGLLGSPCFEIPRSIQRDNSFDHLTSGAELRRGLAAKKRHNTATIGAYLFVQWLHLFVIILLAETAGSLHSQFGSVVWAVDILLTLVFSIAYSIVIERAVQGFRALRPRFCSIYDPIFWRHERFWKMSAGSYLTLFNGTPFKSVLWRLQGLRLGRRVFDDGCGIPEKTLTTIGDDCTLNAATVIQAHSLEDGTFKSDYVTIGAGCTLGTNAFVHYGVTMGDNATLEPDSFLMKGSEVAPHARWLGNPAMEVSTVRVMAQQQ